MGETRTQYIPNVTVPTNPNPYPRFIGEVLSHPFIQNTLLQVLEVWDRNTEIYGNENSFSPYVYGSQANPVTRDWDTPPPRRDESSKHPIYYCLLNGTNGQWISFKWITLDENMPTDLLGYSTAQVASGNAIPLPPVLPNLLAPVRRSVEGFALSTAFSSATFTTSSSVPFTPANITTQLWLDASDSATITEVSGVVSQWNDKSGNARHATQSTAGARPTRLSANINGLDVLSFDNVNDAMITSFNLSATSNYMIFVVVNQVSGSGDRRVINSASFNSLISNVRTGGQFVFVKDTAVVTTNWLVANTTNQSVLVAPSSGNFTYFGNGNVVPANARAVTNWGTLTLGASGVVAETMNGRLGEVIVVYASDESTRQKVEGYLAHKWGLLSTLPLAHPYKATPPTV